MKRTIQGKEYDFKEKSIPIDKLFFWPENPRVYSEVHSSYGEVDTSVLDKLILQEKIFDNLKNKDNVRDLSNKLCNEEPGLAEPLIAQKHKTEEVYYVLEGNRRLAACKLAIERSEKDKDNPVNRKIIDAFHKLPCEIAPQGLEEDAIFSLLGILHVSGKIPWVPFEKATFINRRAKQIAREFGTEDIDDPEIKKKISKELNESTQEITTILRNVKLMELAKEENKETYSYYDVISRNRESKKTLENKEHISIWIGAIKENEKIHTALGFRKLVQKMSSNKKYFSKFLAGNMKLTEAAEKSTDSGSDDEIYKRIKSFRSVLERDRKSILKINKSNNEYKKIIYEIGKLLKNLERLYKQLQS